MRLHALFSTLAIIPTFACAQPSPVSPNITVRNKPKPPFIVRYLTERTGAFSNGPLIVIYNNKSAKKIRNEHGAVRQNDKILEQIGFGDIQLADDRQTLGWTATYTVCAQPTPCATRLVIFRNGHITETITPSHGIFRTWAFLNGGAQVAAQSGDPQGDANDDFALYDTATGRKIDDYVKGNKPDWLAAYDQAKR